jgi:hypothetical protein
MKNVFALSFAAAAFVAGPALAQVHHDNRNIGSADPRDVEVWQGAESSQYVPAEQLFTGRSSAIGAPPLAGTDATAGPGITGEMYNPNGFDQNGVPGAQFESN